MIKAGVIGRSPRPAPLCSDCSSFSKRGIAQELPKASEWDLKRRRDQRPSLISDEQMTSTQHTTNGFSVSSSFEFDASQNAMRLGTQGKLLDGVEQKGA